MGHKLNNLTAKPYSIHTSAEFAYYASRSHCQKPRRSLETLQVTQTLQRKS